MSLVWALPWAMSDVWQAGRRGQVPFLWEVLIPKVLHRLETVMVMVRFPMALWGVPPAVSLRLPSQTAALICVAGSAV